jgi:hypothetical protein
MDLMIFMHLGGGSIAEWLWLGISLILAILVTIVLVRQWEGAHPPATKDLALDEVRSNGHDGSFP